MYIFATLQRKKMMRKTQDQQAEVVLVAPVWKAQPWYALLLAMLVDWPRLLPTQSIETLTELTPRLAVWSISGSCQGLSDQATDLVLKSWRTKANRSYDSLFGRWNRWCGERGSNPFSGPVSEVANFLASLYQEGYQYNSVNAYRSAISSVHEKVDGVPIGQHPLVTRLIKGIFNVRPPMPRYSSTWDVQVILDYLESCGQSENLTLKLLTLKTTFLFAFTRPSRSADLSQLNMTRMKWFSDGVAFVPNSLAKQSRQGKPIVEFSFPLSHQILHSVR